MKYLLFCSFVLGSGLLMAQKNIIPSENFTVEGKVKKVVNFSLRDSQGFNTKTIDSIVIMNHMMERKGVIKNVHGVLLRDILEKAEIEADSPRVLSEYYIECVATDNYKVVFSWNEVFNSETVILYW
jgi:hypothetical protein